MTERTRRDASTVAVTNPATDALLASCGGQARPYEPHFDVIECETGFWIRDHDRPIAYIHRQWYALDAFEFSPFDTLGREPVIDPRYEMGTYINMHAMLFQAIGGNFRWPTAGCTTRWQTDDPRTLWLEIDAEYVSGERTWNVLTIDYDADTGQYRYHIRDRLQLPVQRRQEFCNVYPKDAGNGMPGQKKWQYTFWTGADGRMWKMPHTPALTFAARNWNEGVHKHLAPGGFIGWGVEDDFNLVAVIERASVPVLSATCDMWYDEHLVFEQSGMEYLTDERTSEVEVCLRLFNAPSEHVHHLIDQADCVPISDREIAERSGPAFIFGRINDLETPMDPREPQTGQMWRVHDLAAKPALLEMELAGGRTVGRVPPERHVFWVDDCGRSGTRSIRLRGLPDRILRLAPAGQNVRVEPNTAYRFEGWIKTRGARGRLCIGGYRSSLTQAHNEAESPTAEPDSDWTHVSVQIDGKDDPYVLCRLVVEGDGDAWFDDLCWNEVT